MTGSFLFDVEAHERRADGQDRLAAAGAALDAMCARAQANAALRRLELSQMLQLSQGGDEAAQVGTTASSPGSGGSGEWEGAGGRKQACETLWFTGESLNALVNKDLECGRRCIGNDGESETASIGDGARYSFQAAPSSAGPELSQSLQLSQPTQAAPKTSTELTDIETELFKERAAIIEYDGGLPRHEAERIARACLGLDPGHL